MKIGIAGPILTDSLKSYLNLPESYPKGMGGASVINLIIGLLKLGHNVSVYTLDLNLKEPQKICGDKLKIYFGKYRPRARYRMLDFFYHESKQIRNFILDDKPDFVIAQWGYEYAVGTILSKYPHVIILRDVPFQILRYKKDLYRFIRLLLNLWVMRNGKNFAVNSEYTADKLKRFNKKFYLIPNSIQSKEIVYKQRAWPKDKIKIISLLSGWEHIKNPQTALRAFSLVQKEYGEKIEYHLFGTGYEINGDGYNWAKKNNLLEGVFFHGLIPFEMVGSEIMESDILLHPSKEESFGMTLIEAMAKGVPIIAGKDSGAVPWVLNYGENGLLVNITSAIEIADAIKRLIYDSDLYKKLSLKGLKYVEENFTDLKCAEKLLNVIEEVRMNEL